jgi:hypothetical protein
MWLYTQHGFYAIVEDRYDPEYLWVRARQRRDMEILVRDFMDESVKTDEIIHNEDADYPYRLKLPRLIVTTALWNMMNVIDYDSLKKSLSRDSEMLRRYGMYEDVWEATLDLDDAEARPSGRGNPADWRGQWRTPTPVKKRVAKVVKKKTRKRRK